MSPLKTKAKSRRLGTRRQAARKRSAAIQPPARIIIEGVSPEVDAGRYPAKRTLGESVIVEADIFADGLNELSCVLCYRYQGGIGSDWAESPMELLGNDRWRGSFVVNELGRYVYTISAWIDRFTSWRRNLEKKVTANQDVSVDLLVGAELIAKAASRAFRAHAMELRAAANDLRCKDADLQERIELALSLSLERLMKRYLERNCAVTYDKELVVVVDRERARFGSWYEMFPRSCSPKAGTHGTFADCESRLSYIAEMGFDVLYLPPIHPIGRTNRKGKNNTIPCAADEPGSPWAIGADGKGHKALHPQLGTLADFRRLIGKAEELGIEIALDLAFQCSLDHPYVRQHPEWFLWRPDGSIQYAENPPKKYEDIYPINFETPNWRALWEELKDIVRFWIRQGIRIFRVDNPHTKPFQFWEWLIEGIKRDYPDVIFLSEAFTRPKLMYQLAKLGFTQSYTYFAWRNTKKELTDYFTDLSKANVREFFRPSLWTNTPDILTEYLQHPGNAPFMIRLVLAATLAGSYGIYGPAFELLEHSPTESGKEEYLDAEKYELKHWDIGKPDSLRHFITRVNRIRRQNAALQQDGNLHFHAVDNPQLIVYSKSTDDLANVVLVVVNLDFHYTQAGWVELSLDALGIDHAESYQVHDMLTDARYLWQDRRQYVELNPLVMPAHIFRVRRRSHREQDFDYFI